MTSTWPWHTFCGLGRQAQKAIEPEAFAQGQIEVFEASALHQICFSLAQFEVGFDASDNSLCGSIRHKLGQDYRTGVGPVG